MHPLGRRVHPPLLAACLAKRLCQSPVFWLFQSRLAQAPSGSQTSVGLYCRDKPQLRVLHFTICRSQTGLTMSGLRASHAAWRLDPSLFRSGPTLIHADRLEGSVSHLCRSELRAPCLSFPCSRNLGDLAGFSSKLQAHDDCLIPYFTVRLPTKNAFPIINQPSSQHFPFWLSP